MKIKNKNSYTIKKYAAGGATSAALQAIGGSSSSPFSATQGVATSAGIIDTLGSSNTPTNYQPSTGVQIGDQLSNMAISSGDPYAAAAGMLYKGTAALTGDFGAKKKQKRKNKIAEINARNQVIQSTHARSFAMGGAIQPELIEAEEGEVIDTQDPIQGNVSPMSLNSYEIEGDSHEEGGELLLVGEGFIYSDQIPVDDYATHLYEMTKIRVDRKSSIAHAATKISKKIGEFEEDLDSYDHITKNTAELMIERLEIIKRDLAYYQEYTKMMSYEKE